MFYLYKIDKSNSLPSIELILKSKKVFEFSEILLFKNENINIIIYNPSLKFVIYFLMKLKEPNNQIQLIIMILLIHQF